MKKIMSTLAIIIMLLAGMGMLFYPDISNWLAQRSQAGLVEDYNENMHEMNDSVAEEELQKAREYNDSLTGTNIRDPFLEGSGAVLPSDYTNILNVNGTIGYIEIPEVDIKLMIYHGTSNKVLEKGVGHLERSAFPIGGTGTHSVLTGHSGLSSAKMFTNLEKLELGDVFYITVLKETLAYQIDQILVVDPNDTEALKSVAGEDYVTLITCTPYAVNSHRLLVRGTRIPYVKSEEREVEDRSNKINWRLISVVIVLIILVGIYKYIERTRKRNSTKT